MSAPIASAAAGAGIRKFLPLIGAVIVWGGNWPV